MTRLHPAWEWAKRLALAVIVLGFGGFIFLTVDLVVEDLDARRPNEPIQYNYSFSDDARRISVRLTENGIQVPKTECRWETGMLKLDLDPSWKAAYSNPWIDIHVDGAYAGRQYLGYMPARQQYLNVSPEEPASTRRTIQLKGEHVSWEPQNTKLVVFCPLSLSDRRILVVAPHPDDAEIAAFGLYQQHKENVHIVTVTAGDAGRNTYGAFFADSKKGYEMKGRLRIWNSLTVPYLAGVSPERVTNLAYADGKLASMYAKASASVPAQFVSGAQLADYRQRGTSTWSLPARTSITWASLVRDLKAVLRSVDPSVIVMPHPLLDTHPDHKLSTIAVLEALKDRPANGQFLLYTNHAPHPDSQMELYPFGPREGRVSLPPVPAGRTISVDRLYSFPLGRDAQKLKLFALEAMNDLRGTEALPSPASSRSLHELRRIVEDAIQDLLYGHEVRMVNNSYFRRAPRPNELFFVHSRRDAKQLHERFRAALPVKEGEQRSREEGPPIILGTGVAEPSPVIEAHSSSRRTRPSPANGK